MGRDVRERGGTGRARGGGISQEQELELAVAALGSSQGVGGQSREDLTVPGELRRRSRPQPSQHYPDVLQGQHRPLQVVEAVEADGL